MKTLLMLVTLYIMAKPIWAAPDDGVCAEGDTAFYWACHTLGGVVASLDECRLAAGRAWTVAGFYPCPDDVPPHQAVTKLTYARGAWTTACVSAASCRGRADWVVADDRDGHFRIDFSPVCQEDSDLCEFCTNAAQFKQCGSNACASEPCRNGGRCFPTGGDTGHECYCYGTGYTGATCSEEE